MENKIKIAVVFGGQSAEHEISIISAINVMKSLSMKKYDIFPIAISKDGGWFFDSFDKLVSTETDAKTIHLETGAGSRTAITLISNQGKTGLIDVKDGRVISQIDVVFPVLHGTNGEDGAIQGFLKLVGVPFVGAGVLGSAIGMDKDVMKRLLKEAGVSITDFLVFSNNSKIDYEKIEAKLGLPMFVKPANAGSSVGVSRAENKAEFLKAVKKAFLFDQKIVIEKAISGEEIEISVIGNENPRASLPGRVIPNHKFYDYEAKYIDENGANFEIPAKLSEELIRKIQAVAIQTYQTLCCEGMARVDGFLTEDGDFIIIEINTIPGFTSISMYPKLWKVSGLAYPDLLDQLVKLAIDRRKKEMEIEVNFVNKI
ncbi:MAG: D-alanine--D-alanine ligase [Candidatus Berkelbacteria bacterium]|nr:D-alanine--D-alanine ligase [Candidatus Berkelbacteria bacterium]